MKRIALSLVLFCLPFAALADGMIIPTVAYPAHITIPDQRALICFSNGVERLVIETRFTGAGTNFAWVVPLPSPPVVEPATTGLFPTLQYLFRPRIIHEVPRYYLGILATMGLIYAIRLLIKSGSIGSIILYLLFLVVTAGLLLPVLAPARKKAMSLGTTEMPVSVLERKIVGIFETATIASHDAQALQTWLAENGYSVPTNAGPVIASYVNDGWVFVAAKIRRDSSASATNTPQPLSFTFKTAKPVYPVRLTGLNGKSLSVALYVFGADRAAAPHFKIERCTRPNYPPMPATDPDWLTWRHWSPETPDIVHPLLRKWVAGSPVATKLTATLSPAEMRRDVWLKWSPFRERKNHLFSRQGALTTALNWGAELFGVGVLVACLLAIGGRGFKSTLPGFIRIMAIAGISLAGLTYLGLPKIEVRTARLPVGMEQLSLLELGGYLSDTNPMTVAEISAEAQHLLTNPTNDVEWSRFAGPAKDLENNLLGGRIREEDSPGNFTLRETGNRIEFVAYDAQGAEHILPDDLGTPLKR